MNDSVFKRIIKKRLNSANLDDIFSDGTAIYDISVTVKNDGQGLAKFLNGEELKHLGNFVFSLKIDGKKYKIITEPTDEEYECIKILNIKEF